MKDAGFHPDRGPAAGAQPQGLGPGAPLPVLTACPPWPTAAPGRRVYVESLGCVENALASSRLMHFFAANDWRLVESAENADLVLVNTCGVDEWQERDSLRKIASLRRTLHDHARMVVTGCLVSINPELLRRSPGGDATLLPVEDSALLAEITGATIRLEEVRANRVPERFLRTRLRHFNRVSRLARVYRRLGGTIPGRLERALTAFELADWYFVHISTGCVHACSYCAIRHAKGAIRSRPLNEIVAEVRAGVESGNRRVVLVGDDTGSYGFDRGADLGDLLEALGEIPGDFGIHVRNLEPMGLLQMRRRLETLAAQGHLRAITVPLQSGSDRVLEAMGRQYRVEPVLRALSRLRAVRPDLIVLTHLMVGFPGESRDDFRATLRMVQRFDFDGVAPGCFSKRANTPAAGMDHQVPSPTKRWRYWRLLATIVGRVYLRA